MMITNNTVDMMFMSQLLKPTFEKQTNTLTVDMKVK